MNWFGNPYRTAPRWGGLTEAWRIAWMAYEHHVQWVPHGWNTALGLAAGLQLNW
jgi:L-alanine-DL-glutamate epimerase-like enolase superfamily enzyme